MQFMTTLQLSNSNSMLSFSSLAAQGMQQHMGTSTASFYASLVELPSDAPRWAAEPAPTPARNDHATGAQLRNPVRFKSSGVHDMSNLGQPQPPASAASRASRSNMPDQCNMQAGRGVGELQQNGLSDMAGVGDGEAHTGLGFQRQHATLEHAAHQQQAHQQLDTPSVDAGYETRPALGLRVSRAHRLAQAEALIDAQWQAAQAAFTAKERADAAKGQSIAADNIGFKLLQRAGWQQGQGLGAHKQGPAQPIQALRNPGVQGIGFAAQPAYAQQHMRGRQSRGQGRQQDMTAVGVSGSVAMQAGGPDAEANVARAKRAKLQQAVQQELAGETLQEKLALHRAVMHAEAEAAESKALQRALRAAFNDPFDNVGAPTANSNPLGRRNRLTASNPLLGSDDEDV